MPKLRPEYAPPGETVHDLWIERSNLIGLIFGAASYGERRCLGICSEEASHRSLLGVQLTIFTQCILILHSDNSGRRNAKWLMAYSCAIFLLATFGLAGNIKFIQMCYIDYRNYPGGPNAFTLNFYSTFVNMFGTSAYVVMNWLADGLMVRPSFLQILL